jgi:hypothetical protein
VRGTKNWLETWPGQHSPVRRRSRRRQLQSWQHRRGSDGQLQTRSQGARRRSRRGKGRSGDGEKSGRRRCLALLKRCGSRGWGGGGVRSGAKPLVEEVGEGPDRSLRRHAAGHQPESVGTGDLRAAVQNKGHRGGYQVGSRQQCGVAVVEFILNSNSNQI